ncbi:MAG TPA: thioredoxin family protein [Planctomycetes bacterium]|nr:thioredoxin family protein [Planctomycetota bacterium]
MDIELIFNTCLCGMKIMKKRNKQIGMIVAVVALLVSVLPNVQADDKHYEGWVRSFAEAKELAAKEGKSILMEFTGSDWCPPCKALHKNVLGTDTFKNEITKDFILLVLDNPRDKSLVTDAEQEQYKKLSAQYKVTGVPTVFLADAEGKPYHKQVGYSGDPADKWVANARGKVKVLAQRDEFFAQASEAKGVERAKLLEKAISGIDSAVALALYGDTIDEIISLDADDTAGLKGKYAELRQGAINEAKQKELYQKSYKLFQAGDKEGAKKLLLEAQAVAPKTRLGQQIPQILEKNFK